MLAYIIDAFEGHKEGREGPAPFAATAPLTLWPQVGTACGSPFDTPLRNQVICILGVYKEQLAFYLEGKEPAQLCADPVLAASCFPVLNN